MKKIALKLDKMTIMALIGFARTVANKMLEHADVFPAPPDDLEVFHEDLDRLSGYEQIAQSISSCVENTIRRNNLLQEIKDKLFLIQCYVQIVSRGDEAIINMAGMSVAEPNTRRYYQIVAPERVRVKNLTNTGTVKIRWKRVKNAKQYAIEYCFGELKDAVWKTGLFSSCLSKVITDMPPRQKLNLRVQSLGPAGKSGYSSIVSINVS